MTSETKQKKIHARKAGSEFAEFTESTYRITEEARLGAEDEINMGLWKAVKMYPKAVGWSVLLSTVLVMEGYDLVLMSGFFGQPQFAEKYGEKQPDGSYLITAPWQSGLNNGANVGGIFGIFLSGYASERFGHRKTLMYALTFIVAFIFILFFAENVQTLLAGEILCGIPWGVFLTMTTAYASEVTPVPLRPYLTTYVNICWVFGQLISSGVLRATLHRQDEWAYKLPFALQWVWPVPIFIGAYFAPDSPWWLVRCGRLEEAKHAIRRLTTRSMASEKEIERTVAMIIHTNAVEESVSSGTSYWDCFKRTDLRRTEIAVCAWLCQSLSGSALMGFSTYFFEQAGLDPHYAFDMSIANYGIGIIGTALSWFLMIWFGRRTLYVAGLSMQVIIMSIIGFISIAPQSSSTSWATGAMLLAFTFCYDSGLGPVCYSLVAELPSTRLKAKSMVLARGAYLIANIVLTVINPYMLNRNEWNWKGKAGFFYGVTAFICLIWTFFRLPEPKNRTYGELDVLFEQKISARKFAETKVDPYSLHLVDDSAAVDRKTNVKMIE